MRINFIIGSGRCGTKSLSHILLNQNNSNSIHEGDPKLPYKKDVKLFNKKIDDIIKNNNQYKYLFLDSFYYLWYLDEILDRFSDCRICCLIRGKEEVVDSFYKKITKRVPGNKVGDKDKIVYKNFWCNSDRNRYKSDFDICFPDYPKGYELKYYIERYYDEYYELVNRYIDKNPKNIRLFSTESLNRDSKLIKLLNYLQVDKQDQRIPAKKVQICHRWFEVKGKQKINFKNILQ